MRINQQTNQNYPNGVIVYARNASISCDWKPQSGYAGTRGMMPMRERAYKIYWEFWHRAGFQCGLMIPNLGFWTIPHKLHVGIFFVEPLS